MRIRKICNQSDELIRSEISNQPKINMFRASFGPEGAVRNRFAEREAEELKKLIAQLDRVNFS